MPKQSDNSKQEQINELERLRLDNADLRRQIGEYEKILQYSSQTQNLNNFAQKNNKLLDRREEVHNDLILQLEKYGLSGRIAEIGVEIFSIVIDSLTDLIILFDENLNVIWSNQAAKKTFGEDLVNKKFCVKLLKFGTCSECDICNVDMCLQNQNSQEEEVEIIGPNKEVLHFRWRVNTVPINESIFPRFLFSSLRDITEKKELYSENVRAAQLASLGELAAGVAHEINNPVNAIVNFAQLLEEEIKEKDYSTELISLIIKEGQRIACIVQNLLNFAKKEQEECSSHNLRQILDEALNLSQVQMEKEGIWIEIDLPEYLPQVMVRSQEIQQVFINILSNSRYALNTKFSGHNPEKAVFIRGESLQDEQGEMVRIEFYDKGSGIPQSELSKICDPFYSTKPKGQGTGLGLSISYKIIQEHHGRMFFDSKEGEYTKVLVELPADKHKENVNA